MSNKARMSGRSRGGRSSSFSHVACASASRTSPSRLVNESARSGLSAGVAAEAAGGGDPGWMPLPTTTLSTPSGGAGSGIDACPIGVTSLPVFRPSAPPTGWRVMPTVSTRLVAAAPCRYSFQTSRAIVGSRHRPGLGGYRGRDRPASRSRRRRCWASGMAAVTIRQNSGEWLLTVRWASSCTTM